MTRRSLAWASCLLIVALLAAALVVGAAIPADAELPIHYGIDGEPDRLAHKWTALLMPPIIAGLVSLLFYAMPALEPKGKGLTRSQGLYLASWAASLLIFGVIELAVIAEALDWGIPINRVVVAVLGVALTIIGNQLGKSRRMFLMGVRTPWTLASEEVWIRTHRLAGKLTVAAGGAMVLAALLPLPSQLLALAVIIILAAAAGIPVAYSYVIWRRERREAQASE